jgi:hypothetical protein
VLKLGILHTAILVAGIMIKKKDFQSSQIQIRCRENTERDEENMYMLESDIF